MKLIAALLAIGLFSFADAVLAGPEDTARVVFENATRVGRQLLPPGEYTIRQMSTSGCRSLLTFQSKEKGVIVTVSAMEPDQLENHMAGVVLAVDSEGQHVTRVVLGGHTYHVK